MNSIINQFRQKITKEHGYTIILGIISLFFAKKFAKMIRISIKRKEYKAAVKNFINNRNEKIAAFIKKYGEEVPQNIQKQIINLSLTNLAAGIKKGKFTSRQAVISYCLRSANFGKDHNVLANILFEEAVEDATKKDEQLASFTILPPLYGVPFSVKEHLKVKGLPITAGYSRMTSAKTATEDCSAVELLRNNGAIPIMSSNIPQGLFSIFTSNAVYGTAKNPWDKSRTVGGSSGGEAGLVATKCTPFGLGSDSGGSLRIPSQFCGVYAFKPTGRRISKKGRVGTTLSEVEAFREAEASIGPIGRNVDDLVLVSRSILGKYESDPYNYYSPFDDKKLERGATNKFNIAYMDQSQSCEVAPAIRNAIIETVNELKSRGHNVFPITFDEIDRLNHVMFDLYMALGKLSLKVGLKEERHLDLHKWRMKLQNLSHTELKLLCNYYDFKGEKRLSQWAWSLRAKSLIEFFTCVREKETIRNKFTQIWTEKKIDILLTPVFPLTAPKPEDIEKILPYLTFCSLTNAFDMPSGTIPVRQVTAEEEIFVSKFNDSISNIYRNNIQGSKGLPIGIQISTMSYEDELCLGFMKQIEEIFQFHKFAEAIELD